MGQTGGRDAAAFAVRGLNVHDLGLDPRQLALLRAVDRMPVIAVSRASPGAVALFGGDGEEQPKPVGTQVAANLMRELGFCAAAAAAWIRVLPLPSSSPVRRDAIALLWRTLLVTPPSKSCTVARSLLQRRRCM